jgi:hypothetical protein
MCSVLGVSATITSALNHTEAKREEISLLPLSESRWA